MARAVSPVLLPGDPTVALQAATKQYVDTNDGLRLPLTGGTLTGDLVVQGTGKAYRLRRSGSALDLEGAGASLYFSMWTVGDFSGTQNNVFIANTDGSISIQKAITVPAPVNANDATTKTYVDTGDAARAQRLTPTAVKTAAYTAVNGDYVLANATGGAFSIPLPAATAGAVIGVKKTDNSVNAVTIVLNGTDTIQGGAAGNPVLTLQDESRTLVGIAGGWVAVENINTLGSLDTRYALATRTVSAGTGLTGGGALSANVSLAVAYGTTATTAAVGNDSRLSDARTPLAHVHPATDISSGVLAAARLPDVLSGVTALTGQTGTITIAVTAGQNFRDYTATGDLTFAVPTGSPANHQPIHITVLASGAVRNVTFNASIAVLTGIARTYAIPSGQILRATLEYSTLLAAHVLVAAGMSGG